MADKIVPLVEILPATPDLATLNQMTNPILMVSKILKTGTNKEESQLIVNGRRCRDTEEILKLQDEIPLPNFPKGGAGTYKFEVTDQASGAKAVWRIRLGISEGAITDSTSPLPSTMSRSNVTASTALAAPLGPDSQSLGGGWTFNSDLGVLTSPNGRLYNWRRGQPLPQEELPISGFVPVAPSPNPEIEVLRRTLEATKAQLEEAREQQREQVHREEITRLQESTTRALADMQSRTDAIIAKFTEQPKEDPRVAKLEAQLEEERRQRNEQSRVDGLRAEMGAKIGALEGLLREASANKSDPMTPLLTQFVAQMQAANERTLTFMREFSQQQTAVAAQNALTPDRLFHLMRELSEQAQNSGSSMMNEKALMFMNGLLDTALQFQRAKAEFSGGNGGGGIDWAALISKITDKAGGAVQAVAQARSRQAMATEAQAKAIAAQAKVKARRQPQRQQLSPDEARKKTAAEANNDARDDMALRIGLVPRPAKAAEPAPEPESESEPESGPEVESAINDAETVKTAEVESQLARLAAMTTPQLQRMLDKATDEQFFGAFLSDVKKLRIDVAKGAHTPSEVARYVLEARMFVAQAVAETGSVPIVAEMFGAGQYEYIVNRLLPRTTKKLRAEIVEALNEQLAEEVETEAETDDDGTDAE